MAVEALAGALGGIVSGAIGAYGAAKEREAANRRRATANAQISDWQRQAEQILAASENSRVQLSGPDSVQKYKTLRESYDPSAYVYEPEKFDKSQYRVEDYLNPNRDAILADVAKTAQHTAAGAGLGHSSGALEAITKNVIDKDEQLLKDARAEMVSERGFDYGAYTDYINQQQKKLDSMQQGYRTQLEALRGDITFDQQQTDATLQNRLALGNAIAQSRAQLV